MSDVIYNISSGFFDSVNGDRLYSAGDMNKPYKRVIADGIFPTPQGTPSTDFQVVAVSGMSVAVLAGNAMIGARWAENTDDVGITIAGNSSSSPRIDSIFLHIDTGMDTRAAGVVYRQGTAAGTPTAPAMVQTDNITELRLADILVAPSAAIITQANITDQRGGSDCPWVAGLIQQVDTSALFDQYRAAYAEQQQDQADEWNTFMDHLARDYDISMSLRKHESTYTSTAAASLIPINIDGYDTTKDLLQVYINGIFAVEGTHYIVKSAAQIQLTNAISAGQNVHFVIYKAVMGGAQPIIPTDDQVQDAVDAYMDAHPGALVVDPELSDTSTHAIQNKAVTEAIENVNGRLDQYEDELGLNPKIEASVTTGESNVAVTLLDGINLDLATPYVFTFRIPEAIATDVYIPIYQYPEYHLITLTIPIGQTEKVWTYTTHATVPFADGKVQVQTRATNVHVDMSIEYASAPPSRLDNLESEVSQNAAEIETLSEMSEAAGETIDFLNLSVNKLNPTALVRGKYISKAGVVGNNTTLSYTGFIPVKPGDSVNVVNDGVCDTNTRFRICTAYDSTRTAVESAGKETSWRYNVPDGVMFVTLSLYNTDIDGGKLAVNVNEIPAYSEYGVTPTDITFEGKLTQDLGLDVVKDKLNGIDVSVNRLNPYTVTTGKYINMDGTIANSASVLHTDYIKVNPGEMVYLVNDGVNDGNTRFRYLTAYDSEKVVIPASGKETSYRYAVPEGVSFIILTLYATDYAGGKLAVNINGVFPYSAYNDASANMNYVSRLIKQPYTTLPPYILDNAWYRPLGPLEKGYFCFMTDDGRMGLTEYTIPMVLDKGIKCSFALMSASEVMQNQSDIDIVLNAISHGCEVAQHGGVDWTTFSEYGLNKFFDDEKAFFDSVGIDLHGAVIPGSYNSKLIFALAGARFGVLRGGGDGHGFPLGPYYQYHTAGARSNLYGLSGYNIIDQSLETSKSAVDYALANNKIMIVYTHENELGTSQKATLEGLLDYVIETGITQVTLGDIPNLI